MVEKLTLLQDLSSLAQSSQAVRQPSWLGLHAFADKCTGYLKVLPEVTVYTWHKEDRQLLENTNMCKSTAYRKEDQRCQLI